jgi:hypothetical protein
MSRYIGQCSSVRRRGAADEALYHAMIAAARPVSVAEFLRHVDFTPLLDDEETPREFIRGAKRSDPETGTYESLWGDRRCWYLYTAGFEFIFVE